MESTNEPLNLSTKAKVSEIDYDEAIVNCDKSQKPDENDFSTVQPSNGAFNPNLLLQHHQLEQYLMLQQQHQQQFQDSVAKMHLDKYLKLTNRYLHTMSPFLQHFTPLVGQSPAFNAQAAATAAANLLLTSNPSEDDRKSPESSTETATSNDAVRFFLHKLIEHNFIQQLQQQQQINDLINNNQSNGHQKSPASSVDESEFFGQNSSKSFFDFLKSAAVNASGGGGSGSVGGSLHNGNANRTQQGFKR